MPAYIRWRRFCQPDPIARLDRFCDVARLSTVPAAGFVVSRTILGYHRRGFAGVVVVL